MAAKLIDRSSFQSEEEFNRVSALAASIKKRHGIIAKEQENIDSEKAEIGKTSSDMFFEDLEQRKVPELHGNHEYHIPGDIVSVNFRVSSRPMEEINKKPAPEYLKAKFGDEAYKKVFIESDSHEVNADDETLIEHAQSHPELFRIALRPDLDVEQLKALVLEHPELVAVQVCDAEQYAKAYPAHTTKTTTVKVKARFIDLCSKLDGTVLTKARSVLKALLRPAVSTAVICGNTTKTKSKK